MERRERERQEEEKRRREVEARREEARRIKAIDDKRWAKFCQCAADWQERNKLLAFLVEVEKHAAEEPGATIADNSIDDWIAWVRKRLDGLDPFQEGVASLFGAISTVSWWG